MLKTPFNFLYLGLIEMALPESLIIYCRRDWRDVAISCFQQDFKAPKVWATKLSWISSYIESEVRLMEHWKKVSDLPILDIRYEDLVNDSLDQTKKIFRFVGLTWRESCLKFYENKKTVYTASNWQVRQPIFTNSIGRWKNYKNYFPKNLINKNKVS